MYIQIRVYIFLYLYISCVAVTSPLNHGNLTACTLNLEA